MCGGRCYTPCAVPTTDCVAPRTSQFARPHAHRTTLRAPLTQGAGRSLKHRTSSGQAHHKQTTSSPHAATNRPPQATSPHAARSPLAQHRPASRLYTSVLATTRSTCTQGTRHRSTRRPARDYLLRGFPRSCRPCPKTQPPKHATRRPNGPLAAARARMTTMPGDSGWPQPMHCAQQCMAQPRRPFGCTPRRNGGPRPHDGLTTASPSP